MITFFEVLGPNKTEECSTRQIWGDIDDRSSSDSPKIDPTGDAIPEFLQILQRQSTTNTQETRRLIQHRNLELPRIGGWYVLHLLLSIDELHSLLLLLDRLEELANFGLSLHVLNNATIDTCHLRHRKRTIVMFRGNALGETCVSHPVKRREIGVVKTWIERRVIANACVGNRHTC